MGRRPPFHVPVFVLTHHEREPLEMDGGTTFHFVTAGIESAVLQAGEVAGDLDVSIGGGAATVRQAIAAGLLDELLVNQVPVLLGAGERLLGGLVRRRRELRARRRRPGPRSAPPHLPRIERSAARAVCPL